MRGRILSKKVQRLKRETAIFPACKEGVDLEIHDIPFEMLEIFEAVFRDRVRRYNRFFLKLRGAANYSRDHTMDGSVSGRIDSTGRRQIMLVVRSGG